MFTFMFRLLMTVLAIGANLFGIKLGAAAEETVAEDGSGKWFVVAIVLAIIGTVATIASILSFWQ